MAGRAVFWAVCIWSWLPNWLHGCIAARPSLLWTLPPPLLALPDHPVPTSYPRSASCLLLIFVALQSSARPQLLQHFWGPRPWHFPRTPPLPSTSTIGLTDPSSPSLWSSPSAVVAGALGEPFVGGH